MTREQQAEVQLHSSLPPSEYVVRYHFAWFDEESKELQILMERVEGELWDAIEDESAAVDEAERMGWAHEFLQGVAWLHSHGTGVKHMRNCQSCVSSNCRPLTLLIPFFHIGTRRIRGHY